jgi:citryl-CoA synthetase large subunit
MNHAWLEMRDLNILELAGKRFIIKRDNLIRMKLKEFEAKQLLQAVGIDISKGILVKEVKEVNNIKEVNFPCFVKAQTLANGRGKAGGIIWVNNQEELIKNIKKYLGKKILNEKVTEILVDEAVDSIKELYLGIMFDISKKCPILMFGEGGVNVEENKDTIDKIEINYLEGLKKEKIKDLPLPFEIAKKLYDCFVKFDCKMIEINPLILTPSGKYLAVDCVAVLDDDARYRWGINFPERIDNRNSTKREIAAHDIDRNDHRGVAGKTFIDLNGDIGILTAGGGASMTLMDALIQSGGKPANFTEYSGDPPKEKVEKLTRIVLEKENLSGLLIAGVIANFTNINETLQGTVKVLIEKNVKFPVVIRRSGPHDKEAKIMLQEVKKKYGLDIHYFDETTPLTKVAEIIVNLSNKYREKNGNNNL